MLACNQGLASLINKDWRVLSERLGQKHLIMNGQGCRVGEIPFSLEPPPLSSGYRRTGQDIQALTQGTFAQQINEEVTLSDATLYEAEQPLSTRSPGEQAPAQLYEALAELIRFVHALKPSA